MEGQLPAVRRDPAGHPEPRTKPALPRPVCRPGSRLLSQRLPRLRPLARPLLAKRLHRARRWTEHICVRRRKPAQIFVDTILRGAHSTDIPVQQPTKFELVINLKTAA